jgi:glycosyltransferase involved in cell wall biosynthesis
VSPLVTVITATWRRHGTLLARTIPSVQDQDYPAVEHVIVSDGPDENLRDYLAGEHGMQHPVRYSELPVHDPQPHYGHYARLRGLAIARGTYITYVDDDDSLRPEHCRVMAAALDADPEAGFAVSRMMCHGPAHKSVVGWGRLECGNVGSPMLMHRREVTRHRTWREAGLYEDWELVDGWLGAGVKYANVDAETSDVYPSRFREEGEDP